MTAAGNGCVPSGTPSVDKEKEEARKRFRIGCMMMRPERANKLRPSAPDSLSSLRTANKMLKVA